MRAAHELLFVAQDRREAPRPNPIRPLGELSDFTVEKFPSALGQIRSGTLTPDILVSEVEEKIGGLPEGIIDHLSKPDEKDIALLDLLYLQAGILAHEATPGPRLSQLVERLAAEQERIPSLTYEDLVDVNPLDDDPRLFTSFNQVEDGRSLGQEELDFYKTHKIIDKDMSQINIALSWALQQYPVTNPNTLISINNLLSSAEIEELFKKVSRSMSRVGLIMDNNKYSVFRNYFVGSNGYTGPSGAATTTFPTFEMLLYGDLLNEDRFEYNEAKMDYFPRDGRKYLQNAMQLAREGATFHSQALSTALDSNYPQLLGTAIQYVEFMLQFRKVHFKGAHNQIKDLAHTEVEGTGGEKANYFLEKRYQETLAIRDFMQSELENITAPITNSA